MIDNTLFTLGICSILLIVVFILWGRVRAMDKAIDEAFREIDFLRFNDDLQDRTLTYLVESKVDDNASNKRVL